MKKKDIDERHSFLKEQIKDKAVGFQMDPSTVSDIKPSGGKEFVVSFIPSDLLVIEESLKSKQVTGRLEWGDYQHTEIIFIPDEK